MNTEKRKHIEVVAAIICDGNRLTSSSCHPKALVKEFSYFLMPCHQHGLGVSEVA